MSRKKLVLIALSIAFGIAIGLLLAHLISSCQRNAGYDTVLAYYPEHGGYYIVDTGFLHGHVKADNPEGFTLKVGDKVRLTRTNNWEGTNELTPFEWAISRVAQ